MERVFEKFLSTGFKDLNEKNEQTVIELYNYNYKKFLPENKDAKILEIGCGMGRFLTYLANSGYTDFYGIDISAEAVDYCQEKGITKTKHITDLIEFLNSSPMYDLIVMNDVIEHFKKDEILAILEKIKQKLNADGQLIVKTGNMSSLAGLRIRHNDFTHTVGFTEYSLTQSLRIVGFSEITIKAFRFPKNKVTRLFRSLIRSIVHLFWKSIYFFEFTSVPKYVDEIIFAIVRK